MNSQVEIREVGGDGSSADRKVQLSMYPSLTGVTYEFGGYEEEVEAGAFKRTLGQDPDVILNLEHSGLALASTRAVDGAPTLRLSETRAGLRGVAELSPDDPDTALLQAKARQAPLESSFAFRVTRQTWNDDYTKRLIHEVDLHRGDISIVGRAAAPQTQGLVSMRGRGGREERKRQAELIGKRFIGAAALPLGSGDTARRAPGGLPRSYVEQARLAKARAIARRS